MQATYTEYMEAKNAIMRGQEVTESRRFENGLFYKTQATKDGVFYEVMNPENGKVEFWSTKHSKSRFFYS